MGRIFGFGAERVELPPTASRHDVIERRTVALARCLNMRTTVAVVGAGCSMALGYPDWLELVRGAVTKMQEALVSRSEPADAADRARLTDLSTRIGSAESLTTDDYLVI